MLSTFYSFASAAPDAVVSKPETASSQTKPEAATPPLNMDASGLPVDQGARVPAVTTGATTFRDATITEDSTWRGQVVVSGSVTVAPQTTLTIEPGTVIRFDANGVDGAGLLLVQGRLVARGTLGRPIIFTSIYADPRVGDWQGVVFLATEKKNSLEQCNIKGARIGVDGSFSTLTLKNIVVSSTFTALRCRDCLLTTVGAEFRDSTTGVMLTDSEADLRDLVIKNNRQGMLITRTSLFLSGSSFDHNASLAFRAESSRFTITSSTVSENGSGLKLSDCEGSVAVNRIANNGGDGIYLLRSRVKVQGNSIEHNAGNGLHLEDGAGIAWGNSIDANGGYDCFNGGTEDFQAVGNWWGGGDRSAVAKKIYDRQADSARGRVLFLPLLTVKPPKSP